MNGDIIYVLCAIRRIKASERFHFVPTIRIDDNFGVTINASNNLLSLQLDYTEQCNEIEKTEIGSIIVPMTFQKYVELHNSSVEAMRIIRKKAHECIIVDNKSAYKKNGEKYTERELILEFLADSEKSGILGKCIDADTLNLVKPEEYYTVEQIAENKYEEIVMEEQEFDDFVSCFD